MALLQRRFRPALASLLAGTVLIACGGSSVPGASPDRRAAPEPVAFEPASVAAFADPGSLTDAWADVDGDGDPDRFVGFNGTPARLYRNDGGGGGPRGGRPRFTDVAPDLGLAVARPVRTAAWGDYDADGDPDLFLGMAGEGPPLALFRNDGPAGFAEVAARAGLDLPAGSTRQASWIDHDGDGDLDLFLALRDGPNRLWRNDGGRFTDVTEATGIGDPRPSVGAVWFDLEGDGDLDVYVGNMDGDANGMWRNEGGRFRDVADGLGLAGGGRAVGERPGEAVPVQGTVRPCAADVDGDGDLDLSTANYGPNGVLLNPGGPGRWRSAMPELAGPEGGRYDTCAWADFDHDGRLDLFVNGTVTGGVQYRDHLYRREEGGAFVDVTPPSVLGVAADHGATWVDHDGDGDLDLALTGVAADGSHPLLVNGLGPAAAGRSLAVRVLRADGRTSVPGAVVRVYAEGTRRLLGSGMADTGSGYDAQNDLPVHVGLPVAGPVDVEVTFPGAGGGRTARVDGVDPADYRGRALAVRAPAGR